MKKIRVDPRGLIFLPVNKAAVLLHKKGKKDYED